MRDSRKVLIIFTKLNFQQIKCSKYLSLRKYTCIFVSAILV